jgi:CysZ protein
MSRFWKDVRLGLRSYSTSFGFIRRNGMLHFYLYPILLIVLLAATSFFGIQSLVDLISERLNGLMGVEEIPADDFWGKTKAFFSEAGRYIVQALIWASLVLVFYKLQKYIVLIVMSPIMALVSERTDEIVTGNRYPFSLKQVVRDVLRGVGIALRNGAIELLITVVLLTLNLLVTIFFSPLTVITSPLVTVALFVIGAYFYGFSTMDYTSERYRLKMADSVQLVRRNRGLAVANGSVFMLWLIVPFFGTYIGTIIAPITCTVGATLALLEKGEPKVGA